MTILSDLEIDALCQDKEVTFYTITPSGTGLGRQTHINEMSAFSALLSFGLDKTPYQVAAVLRAATKHAEQTPGGTSLYLFDSLLNEETIELEVCHQPNRPMITPFHSKQITRDAHDQKIISLGLSSYGYDLTCGDRFKVFTEAYGGRLDAKVPNDKAYVEFQAGCCVIPPHGLVLANSVEVFDMPADVLGICLGKSTYARLGVVCNTTPAEPGWRGHLTLEFSNTSPLPVVLHAGEGCAQMIFLRGSANASVTYGDRAGKYQGQGNEPVTARMK